MKVFEFLINPEDEQLGMKAISIVDKPAMESEFIAFNKQEKRKVLFKIDDKKYIVAGLALIPDKLIYRIDEETNEEYLGYFSAETIELIMDKFMKESINGTLKDVNFQHNGEDKANAHLVESYILRTEEMVKAVQAMGIQDAVLGAWFVAYKFDSFEDYDKAVDGGFTGFSIEIMLQRELKMSKNNIKNNSNIVMTKIKNLVDKFKAILQELENEGNTFEDVVVPDIGKSLRIGEIGTPVLWVSVDETGQEITEPAQEGNYILEDGRTVVVDAMGNLVEIKEAGTMPEPINPEDMKTEGDMARYPWEQCIKDRLNDGYSQKSAEKICGKIKEENASEVDLDAVILSIIKEGDAELESEYLKCNPKKKKMEDGSFAEMPEEIPATPEASGETQTNISEKTLGELIDVTKDGKYYISVTVAGGQITEAYVESEQSLVKAADFEAVKTKLNETKEKLEAIKIRPTFTEFTQYNDKKVDTSKMNNLELTMYKLGLQK